PRTAANSRVCACTTAPNSMTMLATSAATTDRTPDLMGPSLVSASGERVRGTRIVRTPHTTAGGIVVPEGAMLDLCGFGDGPPRTQVGRSRDSAVGHDRDRRDLTRSQPTPIPP